MFKPYIVGITGGSASGKTTLIQKLRGHFSEKEICVISQDHYYRPLTKQRRDINGTVNFDLPEAIDFKRLFKDMVALRNGKVVELVEYTFNNPKRFPAKLSFQPTPIIILEGLFILCHAKLAAMFDLKLFIETNEELKLSRRLNRDLIERGMSREQILYQWENHVKPSYDRYLMPYKETVDMVILNNRLPIVSGFENSCLILVNHFKTIIK